jgi:predicted nucleotidyltransferase
MTRDEVIARLKSAESELRALGIDKLYLFGSFARDEATDESDVDVFVEMAPDARFRLETLLSSKRVLAGKLGREADLGTRRSLHQGIKDEVENEAVQVF